MSIMKANLSKINIFFFSFLFCVTYTFSQSPIDVGPQASTFPSMIRGYHFTSPVSFVICGLYVPDDASSDSQNVRVVKFNSSSPPAYPGTTNNFTTLFSQSSFVANTMITCNIQVNAGDIIGVYGSRGSNCINSYSTPNYLTSINGQNVTLQRSGMQSCPNPGSPMQDIWSEVGNPIGRIIMYYNCCSQTPSISVSSSTASVCNGQSVTLYASSSTAGGTFAWSNGYAGDSIVVSPLSTTNYTVSYTVSGCPVATSSITVNVGQSSQQTTEYLLCPGETLQVGSNTYSSQGFYTDTLQSSSGCDSILNSVVFIMPEHVINSDVTICAGSSHTFNGISYSNEGSYSDTLQTIHGCDSIINLNLFVKETYDTIISETVCSGKEYIFGGQSLNNPGQYIDTLQSMDGCDSVVTLSLFYTSPLLTLINESICDDSTIYFSGALLTSSGIYTDTLTSLDGCDSIVSLYLNIEDCEFEISNVLTPNGDGQNDTWQINDLNKISDCQVNVYNRWGQPVYTSNGYQNDWDGTKDAKALPDGVYFYSIIGNNIEYTGAINLLRFKK